jgi:putative sigma-54 modulation protein
MRVELTGRHIDISPSLRRLVERKLEKVKRVVNDAGVSAAVVVTKEHINNVIEVTLHARGEQFLHAVGKATSWESATGDVVAKVLHQVEKMKGKWLERKRRGTAARSVRTPRPARRASARAAAPVTAAPPPAERPKPRVVRARQYAVRPMTVAQAASELEREKATFLVFRDITSDAVSIIYRRDDGQIALIEPEA